MVIDRSSGERCIVGRPGDAASGGAIRGDDNSVALAGPDGVRTGQEGREEQRTERDRSCGRLPVYFTGYVAEILGKSYGFVKPVGGKKCGRALKSVGLEGPFFSEAFTGPV